MSTSIEERVVEMRFDNKQFEENAKESMTTLEKLKEALNFSSSGNALKDLDKATKSVSLDGIAAGVEMLTKRFSTMGIVGMRVIQNITDGLMRKMSSAVNFVFGSITSGGMRRAMNLEQAHFQLQNIIGDEERVQEVMNAANKSVDGTAYSFDVAAKAASQFYASGVTNLESMDFALRGLAGTTATFSADYEQMAMIWTQVAGQGRLMGDQLLQLSTRGANAAVEIAKFMNGINDGSIEASDSVVAAVRSVSKGTKNTEADIRDMVSKGKINFEIFAEAMNYAFGDAAQKANETFDGALSNIKSALARIGAGFYSPLIEQNSEIVRLFNSVRLKINDVKKALVFDEEIGNVNALSKQVTDFILAMAGSLADWIDQVDLTKPMEIFYYGVESVKNVARGLLSILVPIGKAFRNVFLSFSVTDILDLAKGIENLTSKFKLTDRSMFNLQTTFQGVFDIIQLIGQAIVGLISLFVPLYHPMDSMAGGFLEITGYLGRSLTEFSIWIRTSPRIAKAFNAVRDSIQWIVDSLGNFFHLVNQIPLIPTIVEAAQRAFDALGTVSAPYVKLLKERLIELKDQLGEFISDKFKKAGEWFVGWLSDVEQALTNLDFDKAVKQFKAIEKAVKDFVNTILHSNGVEPFINNMKKFVKALKEGFSENTLLENIKKFKEYFTFDKLVDNLEKMWKTVDKVVQWIKRTVAPAFADFSIGGTIAGGTGVAMVYAFVKIAKSFETVSKSLKSIPNMLNSVSGALQAYQDKLKADALFKVAAAIAVLAGALLLLSFADLKRLMLVSNLLTGVAVAIMFGATKLLEAVKKGKESEDALYVMSKFLGKAANNLAKAVKWKAIGGAIKNFAISVGIIVAALAAIMYLYNKDKETLMESLKILGIIAVALLAAMGAMAIMGEFSTKGMKNFKQASSGVLMLALSLIVVIKALEMIFKLEFPEDAKKRLWVLGGILGALGLLAVIIAEAARLSGGGKLASAPILAMTALLAATVWALKSIFKMELPHDWKTKLKILAAVFAGIGILIIALGVASRLAGGSVKAAASILAMCVFIAAIVGSLMILSMIPTNKLIAGSIALGIVLLALGKALAGAGKIVDKNTAKSVLAMAIVIGAITAALGVLSLVAWPKLLKAVTALGSVLLILAVDLKTASGNVNKNSWLSIVAMISAVLVIAGSLVILSNQPWQNMLAASAAMSAVLLSFGHVLKIISKSSGLKPEKIGMFLLATLAIIPIGTALFVLASQPWDGVLAAGLAMGAVLLAFGKTLQMISATKGLKPEKIGLFLLATLSLLPIGAALYILADKPWDGLLAAGLALSLTLVAFTACFEVISKSKPNLSAIGLFALACVGVVAIGWELSKMADQPWQNLLGAAAALSLTLLSMTAAMGVCALIGSMAGPAVAGIVLLDLFIANLAYTLHTLGKIFESDEAKTLLSGGADILAQLGSALGGFVGGIVEGALSKMSEAFPNIGTNLAAFMENAAPFFDGVKSIDESAMAGVKYLADALLSLTGASVIDGLTSWLTGGASFIEFGKQLVEFGPYLSKYYNSIKDVDGGVIEASANAAQVLADMAKTLPNSGGWAGKIFGENNLSDFGKELAAFGPYMAMYAVMVKDIKPEAVQGSADAAKIMAEMAKTLPNSGGWAAKILGDNRLSDFGRELAAFGPYMQLYATSVSGLKSDVVIASANAAQALSSLASNLPNSGGLVSLFTGDNDLASFGEQLVKLGQGLAAYGVSLENVAFDRIMTSVFSLRQMVNVAKEAVGVDTTGINAILDVIDRLGEINMGDFTLGFQNETSSIANAISQIISTILTTLQERNEEFSLTGANSARAYINGFLLIYEEIIVMVETFILYILNAIQLKLQDFYKKGSDAGNKFLKGIKDLYRVAITVGRDLANKVLEGIKSIETKFYQAGKAAGEGFIRGIKDKLGDARAAGREIAEAAYNAAMAALNAHSPSRKMMEAGGFAGIGFVIGLSSYVAKAAQAGSDVGNAAVDGINSEISRVRTSIDDLFDVDPTIRPFVDLTDVQRSADELNRMFNDSIQLTSQLASDVLNTEETRRTSSSTRTANRENGFEPTKVEFNQYNYSPKALSRIEIYRNTQNQLSQFEEAKISK